MRPSRKQNLKADKAPPGDLSQIQQLKRRTVKKNTASFVASPRQGFQTSSAAGNSTHVSLRSTWFTTWSATNPHGGAGNLLILGK